MKTLHLLRHGKSSWKDPLLDDLQRPLKKRGRRDARLMAQAMRGEGWPVHSVFSSSAMRARQTIEEVFQSLDEDVTGVQYMDTLYTFDHRALLDWLSERHEQELTIVGHNPALHDIIEWFSTNSLPKFPTAAYCKLTLSIDNWREFSRGSGKVEVLLTAKGLRESLSG